MNKRAYAVRAGKTKTRKCRWLFPSKEDDPEEQALAPKFLSTSADMTCTEGDQVMITLPTKHVLSISEYFSLSQKSFY